MTAPNQSNIPSTDQAPDEDVQVICQHHNDVGSPVRVAEQRGVGLAPQSDADEQQARQTRTPQPHHDLRTAGSGRVRSKLLLRPGSS